MPDPIMLDIVVQIVNYKTKQYLINCLDSVLGSCMNVGISFKILILENGSKEDLSDIENRYKSEPIEFYYSENNLGFGAGHNLLSKKEDSKYLFVLNPDTVVFKTTIQKLFDFMEASLTTGLCGPRVEETLGFWYHKAAFWPKRFLVKSFLEKFLKIQIFRNISALEFDPILGSALFFRREAFNKIGGFDENLFLYFEEGDVCNSLKTKGWKIFFVYDAAIAHFYRRGQVQPENAKFFKESEKYFYKKWPQKD